MQETAIARASDGHTQSEGSHSSQNPAAKTKDEKIRKLSDTASQAQAKKARISLDRKVLQPEGEDPHKEMQKDQSGGQASRPVDDEQQVITTRSGRKVLPVQRLMDAMMVEIATQDIPGEIFSYQAMCPTTAYEDKGDPLYAYKATADPDTMYMHQAMEQPDKAEFVKAMVKEINDQRENGNWTVVHKSEVPKGALILPAVWQMKRKRDIKTREVKKYKARLNIDGSTMREGIHYEQNYAPVARWNSIRTLLTMTALHNWHTKQLDYVLAFPQAPVEGELYMRIPKGFEIEGGNTSDYVLKLHRNVYGTKNAGRTWNKYLVDKLVNEVGMTQSTVDECVFYKGRTMYVLYTDDSIIAGPDEKEIKKVINDIKKAKLDITVEGDLQDFLGINIERRKDGTIHMTQPHLIKQIIEDLKLSAGNVKTKTTPASSSKLLTKHESSASFDGHFDYRSVIGKLNYLEKGTRSDIAYIVHQCARFTLDPKVEHGEALKWLGRYLIGTKDKGTILKPQDGKDLEVYVDASFAGDWDPADTGNPDTARSRHGYIIQYQGCPILWKSAMQTEICLSTTESEYTGLSYALRDAIPIMQLLDEMKEKGFPINSTQAKMHCRVFEDNSGALEMAKVHKYRPRTKHLNVKLHHFRSYVDNKKISIHKIDTNEQRADYLTKPVNWETLSYLRYMVMGW